MGTRDAIVTVIAYEAYFITKLGMTLGDIKWLKKNSINFDAPPEEVFAQYMKVFRRVAKLYLKSIGAENISISVTRNYLKLIIAHPAAILYFDGGKPRPRFMNLRNTIANLVRDPRFRFHSYGTAWPREKMAVSIYLNHGPWYLPQNSPVHKFSRSGMFYPVLIKFGEIFKNVLKYYEAEMEAFKEDLEYIKSGVGEGGKVKTDLTFKYRMVDDFTEAFETVGKVYKESPVERLTMMLQKQLAGGN